MKVLITVFGNPDIVLSLSKHLSEKTKLTVLLVVSGDKVRNGVLNIDTRDIPSGLITERKEVKKYIPEELMMYSENSFRLWILKTPSSIFVHNKEGLKNYRLIKESAKIINDEAFDVVHFDGASGFLLFMLKYFEINKKVWSLHDYKIHTGNESYSGDLMNKMYSKFNINHIQHSNYLKKEFIKYFDVNEQSVDTVYSGVYDVYDSFKPKKLRLPDKYILFFGRIQKYKGLDILIDAYDRVKYELNDHSLVIAGEGKIPEEIQGKEKVIYINRYIAPSELVQLIKNSRFVIMPYKDATYSGVLMTAYNFNKPVVSSAIGGVPEVVINNKTGLLYRNGDVDELADHIYYLCNNEDKVNEMSDGVKEFRNTGKINWDSVVNKMIEVYEKQPLSEELNITE